MNFRHVIFGSVGTLVLASGLTGQTLYAAPQFPVFAQVHWLGLEQISADTNSAHCLRAWNLPQTRSLVAQTLDKFSRWPGGGATNAASALLRPLLDDLVSSESYLEIHAPSGIQPSLQNTHILLAIRLPADRARLWQTNLAGALEALTGVRPVPSGNGWSLRRSSAPAMVEFCRVDDWTLVGVGLDSGLGQSEFAAGVTRQATPSVTNFWLEADLDLPRLVDFLFFSAPPTVRAGRSEFEKFSTVTRLNFTLAGAAGEVLTRGNLDLSRPLDLRLPPWEIPTNLIHQPLTSFTAVRGIAPWLAALPAWQKLRLSPPPDQAYFWAQPGIPFQTYVAVPLPAASNQLSQLAARLVPKANLWLATNGEGTFQWKTNLPALVWKNALMISPFLIPVVVNQHDYLLGGLYPLPAGDATLPAALDIPNLVYYHFEQSGERIDASLFITQLFRMVFHKPQLLATTAATKWLKNVEPLMGGSTTTVTRINPQQLAFTRQSTLGFTALELQLLADWLESPQFPHGLHTFLAPPDE